MIPILVLAPLLLSACTDRQMPDLVAYVEQVKSRPTSESDAPPTIQPIEAPRYVTGNRRDPFRPQSGLESIQQTETNQRAIRPDPQRRKETLEKYALNNLRLVGTLNQADRHWALILSQDGMIHPVTIGSYLGQRQGRVVDIQTNRIRLVEWIQAQNGWREKPVTLDLRP